MEQLTKNQAVATSQEAVQNQNEPQLRDENAHNDKSVHGVLNPTYQAGLRRDAVQPDIEAERKKRDEIEAGKSYCSRRFGGATCDDKSAQIYRSEERRVGKECRSRWLPSYSGKEWGSGTWVCIPRYRGSGDGAVGTRINETGCRRWWAIRG